MHLLLSDSGYMFRPSNPNQQHEGEFLQKLKSLSWSRNYTPFM